MDTKGPTPGREPAAATPTETSEFQRVEQIFFELASLAPGDRDEAIIRLSGGDSRLEAKVRALVGSAVRIGSFLEQPALGRGIAHLAPDPRDAADDLVGTELGPFRILRRIASGGMGTVYQAARSDGQFEQTVAVKVVKRGMDSDEILRRFRAERRTLAALDHPNIARLLDGGVTPDGRPFLVMEYVDGKPIDVYCDENRLKIRERLQLFRAVCEGVHHAHRSLVIHRDLKPSNILVTAHGTPKLLDFGIAKVLSGGPTDAVTADTERRLTPEYASPEQVAGGPITTATDVYSLGVVLYELLTGSRPYYFHRRTQEELRRIVCTIAPPAPSVVVVGRPSRQRGVSGSTPSAEETTGHPAPVAPVDVPATRGVSSARLRNQLRGDLDNVVLMALRKEPQRRYASADQLAADIGRFIGGLPVQARKDTLVYRASKFVLRHPAGVGMTVAAIVTLATATVLLARQGRRLEQQRDELVASNRRLEESRRYLQAVISGAETGNQGPDAKLGTLLRDAARTLETAPPNDPITRAAAQQAIGRGVMSLGMLPEARRLLQGASTGYAVLPEASEARIDIRTDLAELLFFEGQHAEAEAEFRRLLDTERSRHPGVRTVREGLLLNDLGASLRAQGKLDLAISTQREAIAAREAALGPTTLAVAESRNNLGSALFQKGEVEAAITEFRTALEIRRAILREDHPLIIRLEANLGLAELRADRAEDAVARLTHAAGAWDAAFGADHPGRIATFTSLSMALRKQSKHAEALEWLGRALEWQHAHGTQSPTAIAATEANIGITLSEQGRDAEAEAILARVLPVLRGGGPGSAGITRTATESLAGLYERTGRTAEASELRQGLGGSK